MRGLASVLNTCNRDQKIQIRPEVDSTFCGARSSFTCIKGDDIQVPKCIDSINGVIEIHVVTDACSIEAHQISQSLLNRAGPQAERDSSLPTTVKTVPVTTCCLSQPFLENINNHLHPKACPYLYPLQFRSLWMAGYRGSSLEYCLESRQSSSPPPPRILGRHFIRKYHVHSSLLLEGWFLLVWWIAID